MWWRPKLSMYAVGAAWDLVVELRTGLPEIRAAMDICDDRTVGICLDRLLVRTVSTQPHLRFLWPALTEDVAAAVEALRVDGRNPYPWESLHAIAGELEDAIGSGLPWPTRPDV